MRIELEGCHNFRDLGGYPTRDGRQVRHRRLYRSDGLQHLTEADLRILRELGIGAILDLRSTNELENEGRGRLASEPIHFHHLPLFEGDTGAGRAQLRDLDLADTYFLLSELARPTIARVITTLAECQAPAVYHCAAGKDRTGVVSALLLGLLNVADEVIVADYAASSENLDAIISRLMTSTGYQKMFATLPPETLHANPETMIGFLDRLRSKYGDFASYAQQAGVSREVIEQLRSQLLG